MTSNFGISSLLVDVLVGELKKESNSSLALTERSDKFGHLLIGVDVFRGGRGEEPKLEKSESMLDRELSRESLKLDQHLFFTNLNLSRNLATRKLNSVTDLSSSMVASALSAIRFV